MSLALFATALLSPFFVEVNPEIRSTYQSLGKIVEDRPMQITFARVGVDTGDFGRFAIRNWDVSSLTDRRHDVHRHFCYHTEYSPQWLYDIKFNEAWKLRTELTRGWTLYRGFENEKSNRSYHWWQIDQSLENPYLTPFYRLRRTFRGNDYLYTKIGVRHRFNVWEGLYLTPSVYTEGGNARNQKRVFGVSKTGMSSVSFRLEAGWKLSDNLTAFAYVEEYLVIGGDLRDANAASTYRCAHNEWTHGGVGLRLRF